MSTLQLLSLQRQARQIERQFEALKRQLQSGGSSSINVQEIRTRLLKIREETERELTQKDNTIDSLTKIVENAKKRLLQIREQVIIESRNNSDSIFREHIVKELRVIRDDVVNYENQKQNTILKLKGLREQIVKENNERIELKEEVSTLKSQLQSKQDTIDDTYRKVKLIKQTIIKESANTTPTVFREHIRKQLKQIRAECVRLVDENKRLRRGTTQMNGIEETKEEDSNLIPMNPPNKVPSSRHIESSDDNIKTQLDITYFTSYICPWSMRVWLTFLYKNINYELKYVDLDNKSQEFMKAYSQADNRNPKTTGSVPLIRHNDFYLCESGPLVDYVDRLSSRYPIARTNQRDQLYINITCDFAGGFVSKYFYGMLRCANDEERVNMGKEYIAKCGELNKRLGGLRENNPFLLGNTPSHLYFLSFPFFDRMPIVELFYGADRSLRFNDIFTNNSNLKRWYDAAMALPATKTAHRLIRERENMQPLQYYKKGYSGYIPQNVKVN